MEKDEPKQSKEGDEALGWSERGPSIAQSVVTAECPVQVLRGLRWH